MSRVLKTVEMFLDAKYQDDYDEYSNIKYAELNKIMTCSDN